MKKSILITALVIPLCLHHHATAQENINSSVATEPEVHKITQLKGQAPAFPAKEKSTSAATWTVENLKARYTDKIEPIHDENGSLVFYLHTAANGKKILFITGNFTSSDNTRSVDYEEVYIGYTYNSNTVNRSPQCVGHYFSGNESLYNYHWDLFEWSTLDGSYLWIKDTISNGDCLHLDFANDLIGWNGNPYSLAFAFEVEQDLTGSVTLHFGNSTFEAGPFLSVSAETITMDASGYSSGEFDVSSNASWTTTCPETWLDILPSAASGNSKVHLYADMNTSQEPRFADITVSSFGLGSKVVHVTQAASEPYLNLVDDNLRFDAAGKDKYLVNIYSNLAWSVSISQPWILVDPLSGSMNGSLHVSVSENTVASERTGEITLTADEAGSKTITVEQRGADLVFLVSPLELDLDYPDTAISLNIISNASWEVTVNRTWLSADPDSGSGDATVTVYAEGNASGYARDAEITVNANIHFYFIPVIQHESPFQLLASETSLTLSDTANSTGVFEIISNTSWEISIDQDWLFLNTASGTGNAFIGIAALANSSGEPRTATITITGSGAPDVIVVVTQEGAQTTGFSGGQGARFTLYPVPVRDILHVELNGRTQSTTVSLFNLEGTKIFSKRLTELNSGIDMSPINPGVYILEIQTMDNRVERRKIVKY